MGVEVNVSAVVLADQDDRVLLVRKRGTEGWMNPGGKPEPGESPVACAVREVSEELGIVLDPGKLQPLGRLSALAANEPGQTVVADVFVWPEALRVTPAVAAEIAASRWVTPADLDDPKLAPLFVEQIVPRLTGRWLGLRSCR